MEHLKESNSISNLRPVPKREAPKKEEPKKEEDLRSPEQKEADDWKSKGGLNSITKCGLVPLKASISDFIILNRDAI